MKLEGPIMERRAARRRRKCLGVFLKGMASMVIASGCAADDGAWSHGGQHGSVSLGVKPLPRSWRSAFYVNRGFSSQVISPYAAACGFSFGMRNEGTATVETRLKEWRAVDAAGKEIRFRLPESWDVEWERADVPPSARIAFHWAQFQSENTFEPGDWIMGMATLAAMPQRPFRLIANYRDSRGEHEIHIEQLDCAPD